MIIRQVKKESDWGDKRNEARNSIGNGNATREMDIKRIVKSVDRDCSDKDILGKRIHLSPRGKGKLVLLFEKGTSKNFCVF